ncbi:MAG TPA: hypothetical protein VMT76_06680 [Puia sp.]|nr:hypothetical protein [Puia sp.]
MLIVFAFSVTPKILLHNLVADHRDTPLAHNYSHDQQVSKTGFNCNCDNLVVESPFVNNIDRIDVKITRNFSEQYIAYTNYFISLHQVYFTLRGPPLIMLTSLS